VLIYAVGLVGAFELSLGTNGFVYPLLYEYAPGFSSLRAPARLAVFVLFFLAALAAFGHAALATRVSPRLRPVIAAGIWVVLAAEYCVAPLPMWKFANKPPPLYVWLKLQPPGVVAELPLPVPEILPGDDAYYAYMSTFHWRPMINGYSGYYPHEYLLAMERMRHFQPGRSVDALRRSGVKYVIVHYESWNREEAVRAVEIMWQDPTLTVVGQFFDGRGTAIVFRIEDPEKHGR
jgi:hypothetical protein